MSLVDWGSVDRNKGGKGEFLRLKSGQSYEVRLVHKALPVWRYYNQANKRSIVASNDVEGPKNCPINVKYGEKPKERYAIYVLDRLDGNKMKIMEAPAGVFRRFREYFESEGNEPGGKEAPNFKIKVEGVQLSTTYTVTYTQKNFAFTEEEMAVITDKLKNNKLDEMESLKAVPADEREAKLYGGEEEGGESKSESGGSDTSAKKQAPKGDSVDW